MVTTRSNSDNQDTMERILEMLMADRQNRDAERQQLETRFARLETMVEKLSKQSEDGTPKGSFNGEGTPKNNAEEGKAERWRKLEIPVYDGESDAYSWVNKLERFFQMRDILEEEKIQAVMVALDGKALSWFQWWETCNTEIGWEDFKLALLERFQTSATLNPFAALLALKQEETVEEYVEQFEKFAGMLKNVDEEHLKDIFVNGLKEDIKAEIKLYEPPTLSIMVKKALMIEQKNRAIWMVGSNATTNSNSKFNASFRSPSYTKTVTYGVSAKGGGKSNGPSNSFAGSVSVNKPENNNRPRGFQRLTEAELQEKRKKGECFRCEEKWSTSHVCRNKQLRIMLVTDEDDVGGSEEETEPEIRNTPQLSMNSIVGFTSR